MIKSSNSNRILYILIFCSVLLLNLSGDVLAKNTDRPNILFCIADDASFAHMGAYGCSWVKTPGFDRVANEGLLFTRCYTPNAKCAPSRACILTGRNSWQLEEACNHWCFFPAKFKTYAEVLAEQGYHVGKTGKGWAPGIAKDSNDKPRLMTGQSYDKLRKQPSTKAISNNDYAGNFAAFLEDQPADQPFCFWYGSTEPHRGYEYGSGIKKGGKSIDQIDVVPPFWPDNSVTRTDMLDYAFEIEHFDNHLAQMLDLLEQKGQLENTLVVVTADNGMPFPRVKGQEYEYSNHLPLAIMWPAGIKNPGRKIEDFVSFIDFVPTFLEVAEVEGTNQGMQPITGTSLLTIFNSEKSGQVIPERDFVLIGKERHDIGRPEDAGYPIRGIVQGDYLYLKNFKPDRWPAGNPETGYLNCDGSPTKTDLLSLRTQPDLAYYWEISFGKRPAEEFYNIKQDPYCLTNLAETPQHQKQMAALRTEMTKRLTEQQDPRILGDGDLFDQYPYANKTERGFYERYMNGEKIKAGWVNPSDFEPAPLD